MESLPEVSSCLHFSPVLTVFSAGSAVISACFLLFFFRGRVLELPSRYRQPHDFLFIWLCIFWCLAGCFNPSCLLLCVLQWAMHFRTLLKCRKIFLLLYYFLNFIIFILQENDASPLKAPGIYGWIGARPSRRSLLISVQCTMSLIKTTVEVGLHFSVTTLECQLLSGCTPCCCLLCVLLYKVHAYRPVGKLWWKLQ